MAWGNNMGDLFANVAISRAGHTRMVSISINFVMDFVVRFSQWLCNAFRYFVFYIHIRDWLVLMELVLWQYHSEFVSTIDAIDFLTFFFNYQLSSIPSAIVATVHILRQVFNQVPPSIVPFTFDKSLMVAGTASVFVTIGWFVHAVSQFFLYSLIDIKIL